MDTEEKTTGLVAEGRARVKPTLSVLSVQRVAFNDERIVAKNDDYEINIRVLNPEYQGFYGPGELALDPDEVDALVTQNEELFVENDELKVAVENYKEEITELEAEIEELKKSDSSEAGVAEKEAKIADLEKENLSLGSTVSLQASTISSKDLMIEELNSDLAAAIEQITTLKKQTGKK